MSNVEEAVHAGARLSEACKIIGISARTYQRWKSSGGGKDRRSGPHTVPANRLTAKERREVINLLNSKRFRNLSPKQVVPMLADEGRYVASESTMYRLLRAEGLSVHRAACRPATRHKPRELKATGPNQVYSWDITYLKTPVRGIFSYLYMVVDVWSRKIMGWAVHDCECALHARKIFLQICHENDLAPEQVTLHSDNGGPMRAATLRATLERLQILTSFSRPRVSDDNPFSEALFRTLKYRPEYPSKPFASIEAARTWVEGFVEWYNNEHKHSAIGFVTPSERHEGAADAILAHRHKVYERARARHPERWTGNVRSWEVPDEVYLNPEDPANHVTSHRKTNRKEEVAA